MDPHGFVTDWNAGAERLKGFTAQEIVGQHFSCLFTPAQDELRTGHLALVGATVAALTMLLGMVLAILAFRNLQRMEAARRAGDQRFGLLVQGVADHALYMVTSSSSSTTRIVSPAAPAGTKATSALHFHGRCLG